MGLLRHTNPNCSILCTMPNSSNMYVRCKRKNQVYFINTSKSETIFQLKEKISNALSVLDEEVPPKNMRIFPSTNNNIIGSPIPDTAIISDHSISNDDELYVVFRKEEIDEDDEECDDDSLWEDVHIMTLE